MVVQSIRDLLFSRVMVELGAGRSQARPRPGFPDRPGQRPRLLEPGHGFPFPCGLEDFGVGEHGVSALLLGLTWDTRHRRPEEAEPVLERAMG